jgi:phage gp16-like protein
MIPPDPSRNALISSVHIQAKQAGLDEDTYRAMLVQVTGQDSCRKLGMSELRRVAAHLRALAGTSYPGRPTNMAERPQLRKIEALLTRSKLPWSYADGIARQMFGIDRIGMCEGQQLAAVITALDKAKPEATP